MKRKSSNENLVGFLREINHKLTIDGEIANWSEIFKAYGVGSVNKDIVLKYVGKPITMNLLDSYRREVNEYYKHLKELRKERLKDDEDKKMQMKRYMASSNANQPQPQQVEIKFSDEDRLKSLVADFLTENSVHIAELLSKLIVKTR